MFPQLLNKFTLLYVHHCVQIGLPLVPKPDESITHHLILLHLHLDFLCYLFPSIFPTKPPVYLTVSIHSLG
jgi:hypothetical protein